jgi:hypothetical protein
MKKLFTINQACSTCRLGLCCIFMLLSCTCMSSKNHPIENEQVIQPQLYNVANIVSPTAKCDYYTITFYQSARFYKLYRKNKNCKSALALLKYAKKNDEPVLIFLTENFGDVIADVKKHKN